MNYNISIKRQVCFEFSKLSSFESIKFVKVAASLVLVAISVIQKSTVKLDACSYLYSGSKIDIEILVLDHCNFHFDKACDGVH